MAHMEPAYYKKRILLAVTGLTPQVVTETLYALIRTAPVPFIPTEVHVLTTAEGAQRARLTLLSADPGWFHRFCRDFGITELHFDAENIHTLSDEAGNPLDDIRTPEHNACVADAITERIRKLTENNDAALHVSLAGGRKTLGFYAGYALSLFGRPQDRLSHVLVSQDYESVTDFFYPTPYSRVIFRADNTKKPLDTKDATVTLAEIPFVRLRDGLPSRLLEGKAIFRDVVRAAQEQIEPLQLAIHLKHQRILAGGTEIKLSPVNFAFYYWFARRKRDGLPPLLCPIDGLPEESYAREFLHAYMQVVGEMGAKDCTLARFRQTMSKQDFEERKSKLNAKLKSALGLRASPFLIDSHSRRPKRFELMLDAQAIMLGN